MNRIDLGRVISTTIDLYKRDWPMHIVANLVVLFVDFFSFNLFIGTLSAGYFRALQGVEQGKEFKLGDIFSSFNDQLGLSLITGLIIFVMFWVGTSFCVLPGLLIWPMFPLAIGAVTLGNQTDFGQAIKQAWELLKENWPMAFITTMVLIILSLLGVVFCYVGLVVTLPIGTIGWYVMASQLYAQADDDLATSGSA